MKRDNDLIRSLLLEVESDDEAIFMYVLTDGSSDEERRKYYHLKLLTDAGMLDESGRYGGNFRMTNSGHDFIACIRNESIWSNVKEVASSVGGVTLGLMIDIAKDCLKTEVKRSLGVDL